MKKVLYSLGIIGLLTPFSIKALTGDVTVSCAKDKLLKGETTTCTVKGNITEGVSAVSAKVDLGENLTFVSFTPDSSWQGDGEEGNIELYTDNNKSGNFNIGTITVKAGDTSGVSTRVGLKEVKLSDASFVESSKSVQPFSIRILSEVNTLSSINMLPTLTNFDSNKTNYEVDTVPYQNLITISPVLTDRSATLSGDTGEKSLSYGVNNFKITVTSETGVSKDYNIKVTRPEARELTSLKINNESIELKNGVYEYTYKVNNDITKINLDAEYQSGLTEGYLRFADGFGSRTVEDLKVGNNEVLIKVADGYNEELIYKITINRLDEEDKDVAPETDDKKSGTVSNPKTGVTGVSISLVVACIVGYAVAKKKSLFKKKI